MAFLLDRFWQLWVVDAEFIPQSDGTVWVVCVVALGVLWL
jgi:hypothetical protein